MKFAINTTSFRTFDYGSLFIIVGGILGIYLIRMFLLWGARKLPKYYDATKSIVNWFTFFGILIFLLMYFSKAKWMFAKIIKIGSVDVTLFLIIVAILIISLASRLSKISTNVILPGFYHRYNLDKGMQFTLDRIVHYSIMIIAIIMSLNTVGINLSALTVFAGIISVGIGFGLQNIASNFISGIILLFERPIKVGDRVIIENITGDVEKINMRATIIKTVLNEHIIVPNSYFLQQKVINRSFGDPRTCVVIPIGVAYGTDVENVRDLLLEAAMEEHAVSPVLLASPEPSVSFVGFGDFALNFELNVWVQDPNKLGLIKSNLNFRINRIFTENHIDIPYPQMDLHIRSMVEKDKELVRN
ncbi:mechanosensitive ion channel family protein [Bacillus sp. EB600]|uniref:mechanosensitive ion channel family protein n=1 Tax=Bacillus sp. EB600 TaxID=2806345 RepID=UPI002108E574|nr:mechanosensitive ion channel domain-containing protein [Bacillus sp. EB600]